MDETVFWVVAGIFTFSLLAFYYLQKKQKLNQKSYIELYQLGFIVAMFCSGALIVAISYPPAGALSLASKCFTVFVWATAFYLCLPIASYLFLEFYYATFYKPKGIEKPSK